jgi:hypothetical protein
MREFLIFVSLFVKKLEFLAQAQYMREFLFFYCLTFGHEERILSTGSVYA